MKTTDASVIVCIALTLLLPTKLSARGKVRTGPGTYKQWNGEIDHLTIVQPFRMMDYKCVVVLPFETQNVQLPDEDDSTYQPVKAVLATSTASFTEELRKKLAGKLAVDGDGTGARHGRQALVLHCRVTKMDPGSQGVRYFGGLAGVIGGAAATRISGDVADGASSRVLLRFTQERRSGVGLFGGDYEDLMRRNLRAIGEDVAGILKAF